MIEWTYKRGRWIKHGFETPSLQARIAQERLRKWNLQDRWLRFPQLGPVPDKWIDVKPEGFIAQASVVMTAYYLDPISEMMNSPTSLLRHFEREPKWKPNSYPLR